MKKKVNAPEPDGTVERNDGPDGGHVVKSKVGLSTDVPTHTRLVELAVRGLAKEMEMDAAVETASVEGHSRGDFWVWVVEVECVPAAQFPTAEDVHANLSSGCKSIVQLAMGADVIDHDGPVSAMDEVANGRRLDEGDDE